VTTEPLPLDPDLDPLQPPTVLLVFVGGCLGGLARYAVTRAWPTPGSTWQWATLAVNLSGAFALGLLLVTLSRIGHGHSWPRRLLGTGFLGAWTTFSSIAVTTDRMVDGSRDAAALGYLGVSLVGGVLAAALGALVAAVLTNRLGRRAC
jgi:CrcB protein